MRYTPQLLQQLSTIADPLADQCVQRIYQDRYDQLYAEQGAAADSVLLADQAAKEVDRVFKALITNLHLPLADLPPYVQAYYQEATQLPAWADQDKIARASTLYLDHCLAFSVVLYYRSLPECYLIKPIADVLEITGRLSGREWPQTFARRVGETTQFVMDVMAPGGLAQGGIGIETLVRVRLIHASIRFFVKRSPEWPAGVIPNTQEDLGFTLMTFGFSMIDGLKKFNIQLSTTEKEDFFHAWLVAGHIMGVSEAVLPRTLGEATELMEAVKKRHAKDSTGGKACTRALVDFSKELLAGSALDVLPESLILHFTPKHEAHLLGVAEQKGCVAKVLPKAILVLLGVAESIEDKIKGSEDLVNKLGMAILKGLRRYFSKYRHAPLRLPDSIAAKLGRD